MKRRQSQKDKELADNARLLRAWRAFHCEEKAAVLAGPYARTLAELFRAFANIECVQPAQLVGLVGMINWSDIDSTIRLTVLHELNSAIVRYREKRGLPPIDDPLPGEPDNAFRIVKKLFEFSAPSQRGQCAGGLIPVLITSNGV
jgi:hypothetical protein